MFKLIDIYVEDNKDMIMSNIMPLFGPPCVFLQLCDKFIQTCPLGIGYSHSVSLV